MYTLFEDNLSVDVDVDPVYLYKYFLYSGLRGYIVTKVSGLLTVIIVLLLVSAFSAVRITEDNLIFEMRWWTILLLSLTALYLLVNVFLVLRGGNRILGISRVYKGVLGITDSDLVCTSWPEVSQRVIVSGVFPWNDHLSLSSRVNTFDNYFLGLVSDGGPLSDFPIITKSVEWYIRRVLFGYTFSNSRITVDVYNAGVYNSHLDVLTEKFRVYLLVTLALGVLSIPFVFIYLIIHGIIRYSKDIRDRPKIMTAGAFTTYAKWKYREYNEYKNQFDKRISEAGKPARKYLALQKSPIVSGIRNLISFTASALLFFVVVLGTVNDSLLTGDVFFGKSGLFYIAVLSAIIGITRVPAFTHTPREEYAMCIQEFAKHTHADISMFINKEHLPEAASYIRSVYRYRAVVYLIEVLSVFCIPYLGYTLYKRAREILLFFAKTDGSFRGDRGFRGDTQTQTHNNDIQLENHKLEASFINFNNTFGSFILN